MLGADQTTNICQTPVTLCNTQLLSELQNDVDKTRKLVAWEPIICSNRGIIF